MMVKIALIGAAAYGLYQGIKWVQAKGSQHDNDFRKDVLHDAAEMIAPRIGRSVREVENCLNDEKGAELHGIVARVECVMTKLSPSECECKVVAAVIEAENVALLSMTRTVAWDELASQVRHDFIRLAGKPQTYVMFEPSKRPVTEKE